MQLEVRAALVRRSQQHSSDNCGLPQTCKLGLALDLFSSEEQPVWISWFQLHTSREGTVIAHSIPRSVSVPVVRQRGHITLTWWFSRFLGRWYWEKAVDAPHIRVVSMYNVHNGDHARYILCVLLFFMYRSWTLFLYMHWRHFNGFSLFAINFIVDWFFLVVKCLDWLYFFPN